MNYLNGYGDMPLVKAAQKLRNGGFPLESALRVYDHAENGTYDLVLSPESKALWFQMWCAENSVTGSIHCDFRSSQVIDNVFHVICEAKVLVNGEVIASDVASRAAYITDPANMDNIVQICSTHAKGRALSNAGFGACCSYYDLIANNGNQNSGNFGADDQEVTGVFAGNTAAQAIQASASGNAPIQAPSSSNAPTQMPNVAAAHDRNWAMNYRLEKGMDRGKTLGELLQQSPAKIIRYAGPNNPDPESREAASVLLNEANTLCGK